jgi:2-(1,2-epoxy-1,2-dihydrophenyl)acetyl-CoA isomerase
VTYETILTARDGDVLAITLNKPERLNAMSPAMADEINVALDDLNGIRAVLVTGAGRAFCSGADLQARGEASIAGGNAPYAALTKTYNPLMMKLARLPVPVVTAVNGPAAGIGCSLALAGDFAVAGKSAYFLQAFVNIGLVPDGGGSWMLPRLIGKARATEMMMLGEKIGAEKAESWGLIHKCVDDDALIDEARALATRLASGPTVALGIMRQNIAAALEVDYASALVREAEGQRVAGASADAMEGGLSFLQKRKATFQGR